jgi:hypothetical protein
LFPPPGIVRSSQSLSLLTHDTIPIANISAKIHLSNTCLDDFIFLNLKLILQQIYSLMFYYADKLLLKNH